MGVINKIDYYCGAFLSILVSEKVTPTLFEAGEFSKIVRYTNGKNDYKIYLKYSAKSKANKVKQIEYTSWRINFTVKDMQRLQNFSEPGRINYLVCVCTNEKLKDTSIAVLTIEDALSCLGNDTINIQKTLVIKHQKSSPKFICYGTALNESKAIEPYYDFQKYIYAK